MEQITENPYLQYFIGLPGYQNEAPFDASALVLFRKRISSDMLMEANDYLLDHKDDDKDNTPPSDGGCKEEAQVEEANKGTLTLDATCAPAYIRYPQDISLLNEAREKLEAMIHRFSKAYGLPLPRRYSKQPRKDYLAFAKSKKHTAKRIRKELRKQLGYVARDIRYVEEFMSDGYTAIEKEINQYLTIITLHRREKPPSLPRVESSGGAQERKHPQIAVKSSVRPGCPGGYF